MRPASALSLIFFAGCAGPCGSSAPIVAVTWLQDPEMLQGLALEKSVGETELNRLARDLPGFSLRNANDGETGWQLTVGVRLATERADDEQPQLRRRALGLSAELRALGAYDGPSRFMAEALEQRVEGPEVPTEALIRVALATVMSRLRSSIRLARASPEEIATSIQDGDPHVRAIAVTLARERGLKTASAALEARLGASDVTAPEVLRIGAALAELGGDSSVAPLIEASSRFRDTLIPIIFVLARMGGREAEAFLFTLQNGHDRPEVRAAAADALLELRPRP